MPLCLECGKRFVAKRSTAKYCSGSCRSNAAHKRQRAMKKYRSTQLDMFAERDLKTVRACSPDSAAYVLKVLAAFGNEAANDALDALWDLGVNLRPDLFTVKD